MFKYLRATLALLTLFSCTNTDANEEALSNHAIEKITGVYSYESAGIEYVVKLIENPANLNDIIVEVIVTIDGGNNFSLSSLTRNESIQELKNKFIINKSDVVKGKEFAFTIIEVISGTNSNGEVLNQGYDLNFDGFVENFQITFLEEGQLQFHCSNLHKLINQIEKANYASKVDKAILINLTPSTKTESSTIELKPFVGYFNSANDVYYQMDDTKEYDGSRAYDGIIIEFSEGSYSAYNYSADEYVDGTEKFRKQLYENVELRADGKLYFETNTDVPKHIQSSGVLTNSYSLEEFDGVFVLKNISEELELKFEYYKTEKLPKFIQSKIEEGIDNK